SDEKVPSGRLQLQEYEGNKMIVTLDKETLDPRGLELAYRYARCRSLMSAERELARDAAGVRDAADEALSPRKDPPRLRRARAGVRRAPGPRRGAAAARGALQVEAPDPAPPGGTPRVGGRPPTEPRVPRPPLFAPGAGRRRAARAAGREDLLAAAGPLEAAL